LIVIWLPLLRAKLGDNYQQTSAAFIWATIARMYAARRAAQKRELLGFVTGGYARILEKFESDLRNRGVQLEVGSPVTSITGNAGAFHVTTSQLDSGPFDGVAVTMAGQVACRLAPALTGAEKEKHSAVTYQGIICASVLLRRPLSTFYTTNITDEGVPFTAVIDMSALVGQDRFGGSSLVYLPKYLPFDSPKFSLSDDEVEAEFLSGLSIIYPSFDRKDVISFKVSRVRYVFPIPTLHYSDLVPPMTTSIPGLYIVNSSQIVNGTLNVNETVQLAQRAVQGFDRISSGLDKTYAA
jgi:protoporphyrinogen oxidase